MPNVPTPASRVSDAASACWKYFAPIWLFCPVIVLSLGALQHFHVPIFPYASLVVPLGFLLAFQVSRTPVRQGVITRDQWFSLAVAATFLIWVGFVIASFVIGVLVGVLPHAR